MDQQVKNQFKDFVIEEIIPELLANTGYSEEELMDQELQLEELEEPEIFNNEVMNNYRLVSGDYTFECFLDDQLIQRVGDQSMTFRELLDELED
jgi:hypothetical protein